MSIV
jgi:hypothetical protein